MRRRFISFLTLIGSITFSFTPAYADQVRSVTDNGTIEGYASSLEITRLSLIGDRVASVQKTDTDEFGDDFNIAHDTVTGDLYITLPAVYEQTHLSFFITTKKGFTYKAHLAIRETPSTQIFVQNPGAGSESAEAWEQETPFRQTVIRLIRAMWSGEEAPGYDIRHGLDLARIAGPLTYRVTSRYDGGSLVGRVLKVENSSNAAVRLTEDAFLSKGVLAASLGARTLAPRASTYVYVVAKKGAA